MNFDRKSRQIGRGQDRSGKKKFVDSYSENSWKHVVNSIVEEEEEGDEEQGPILLTADEIEKMGK